MQFGECLSGPLEPDGIFKHSWQPQENRFRGPLLGLATALGSRPGLAAALVPPRRAWRPLSGSERAASAEAAAAAEVAEEDDELSLDSSTSSGSSLIFFLGGCFPGIVQKKKPEPQKSREFRNRVFLFL